MLSISEYNNSFKLLFTATDIFKKYVWSIPLLNKSGISMVNGPKTVLLESREPKKVFGCER